MVLFCNSYVEDSRASDALNFRGPQVTRKMIIEGIKWIPDLEVAVQLAIWAGLLPVRDLLIVIAL